MNKNAILLSSLAICLSAGSCLHASEGRNDTSSENLREYAEWMDEKYHKHSTCRNLHNKFMETEIESLEVRKNWYEMAKNPDTPKENWVKGFEKTARSLEKNEQKLDRIRYKLDKCQCR